MTGRGWIKIGAGMGCVAVAAGAFGAHGLQARVEPAMLEVWEVAARYQMYHALALVLLGVMMGRQSGSDVNSNFQKPKSWNCTSDPLWQSQGAGWLFLAGIVIFSGSLYAMVLSGAKWLGAVTPIGGMAFIVGWVCLALGARRW